MTQDKTPAVDMGRIAVTPGAEDRVQEIWQGMVGDLDSAGGSGTVRRAQLLRPVEDGAQWIEAWEWTSQEDARAAIDQSQETDSLSEMHQLTDVVAVEWYHVVRDVRF